MRTMKALLRDEIIKEKLSSPHNVKYIQRLQQMMDYDHYTIKDFVDTGLIMPREEFEKLYAQSPNLHKKCTEVSRYVGGHYIQLLSDGNFLLNYSGVGRGKRSKDLQVVESYLWDSINPSDDK